MENSEPEESATNDNIIDDTESPTVETIEIDTDTEQKQETSDTSALDEWDPMLFVQLGDRIMIDSAKYGGQTIGTVYYRSLDLIRVKPDGVSNSLRSFDLEQIDDEEKYKEEDGVRAVYVLEKRSFESFVEQQDFRVNQVISTFDSDGDLYKTYKIIQVDKEQDAITIQEYTQEEEGPSEEPYELRFNFVGIEPDEDFVVISISEMIQGDQNIEQPSNLEQKYVETDVEEEVEEEDGIEIIGVIEVTRPTVFREALSYEQYIPDNLQRIDALNDFLSEIDPIMQKNPQTIRAIRILVETLFHLKQESIDYNDDGSVKGPSVHSAHTLSELIQRSSIPLGRPVLNVIKKFYGTHKKDPFAKSKQESYAVREEDTKEDDIQEDEPTTYNGIFTNFELELTQMNKNISKQVSGGAAIREWNDQKVFLEKYGSSWKKKGEVEPMWKALSDSQFFRSMVPSVTDGKVDAIIPGYIASHSMEHPPIFDNVSVAIERALATTYRKGIDRKKQVLIENESAPMNSYLLFPIAARNYMGKTRTQKLAVDSGRSHLPPKTMKMLLEELGEPKEMGATSKDIVLLSVLGETLGNIPFVDYVEGLPIPSLGINDAMDVLEQYGVDDLELYPELVEVLLKKITLFQSQLMSSLTELRTMLKDSEAKTEQNPFIDTPLILEEIRSQSSLSDALMEYERINVSLAQSDLGKVIYLMKHFPNYFQVACGKNPVLIAKAMLESNNTTYLSQLLIANTIKSNETNAGTRPKRNACTHVSDLVLIRRIKEDSERFRLLTTFYKKYQGKRNINWIDCNVCKEHLLCIHERLQLQAYLNPKEKDSIEKEIILSFSGGQFQGKYICRNCGQSIHEMEYDNHLEFDSSGKPKSGSAVLLDDDMLLEEKIDELVSVPIEPSPLPFNEHEMKCYNIIRTLSEQAGIQLDNESYRNTVTRAVAHITKFPSSDEYAKKKKSSTGIYAPYQTAVARNVITSCAVFLLIEIQTKIPAYVPRFSASECADPGFGGYPLDQDKAQMQGMKYVACVVSAIRKDETPWNETGFQKVADDVKRQSGILYYITDIMNSVIRDDIIQSQLSEKRLYVEKAYGMETSQKKDMIFSTFLPEQLIMTPELAAKDVITPEVLAAMKDQSGLARLWIRLAHMHAKNTASLTKGLPFSETTCCMATIQTPGTFWQTTAEQMPPIGKRLLTPNQQGNFLLTNFVPRASATDVVEPNKDLYYRIFLKYCFQGEKMGHIHEPGVTNRCKWCGFQFPTYPSVMNSDTEGKTALSSQEVKTGLDEFTELLDKIHTVNNVDSIHATTVSPLQLVMNELGTIEPPLFMNVEGAWKRIVTETSKRLHELPPDASVDLIAEAQELISNSTNQAVQTLMNCFTVNIYEIIENIVTLPWASFFQVIQTYFIVPFQRLLVNFSQDALFIPMELRNIVSETHAKEILKPILLQDMIVLKDSTELNMPSHVAAKEQLEQFIKQLRAIAPFKHKIRASMVRGGQTTLEYFQKAFFYEPLMTLIDPDRTQCRVAMDIVANPSSGFLRNLVTKSLVKYNKEKLSFNDEEIKNRIAIRDEKERVNVVAEFDKLTDEERAMELMNKRLGLGKWSVGGTKLIYAYDKEYFDLERQKRMNAGIVDFPDQALQEPQGIPLDPLGFPIRTDAYYENEGGYDNNQHADDDFE